jgi:hypothetical protein
MKIFRNPNYIKPASPGVYGWFANPETDFQEAAGHPLPMRDLQTQNIFDGRNFYDPLQSFQVHAETRNMR